MNTANTSATVYVPVADSAAIKEDGKPAADAAGVTPLMAAAQLDDTASLQLLLAHHASPGARDKTGRDALLIAALSGNTPAVRVLLQSGASVRSEDDNGATALTIAARRGAVELVRILLTAGAPLDSRTKSGASPLMQAAASGNAEVVALLLKSGAAVNATDLHGEPRPAQQGSRQCARYRRRPEARDAGRRAEIELRHRPRQRAGAAPA